MVNGSNKLLAVFMVFLSAIGLLLSVFLIVEVWRFKQPVTNKLQSGLNQASVVLQTTDDGLDVLDQVVLNVYTSTLLLNDATDTLAQSVNSTSMFMDTADSFVGVDLINTITNTQAALVSAQASAGVIDNILTALSRIPLIGLNYNPQIPLNNALGKVADSLSPLERALKTFQSNLETTKSNINAFNQQITGLQQNINEINQNLMDARKSIANYREQVTTARDFVDEAKTSLPRWTNILAWVLTVLIIWLGFFEGSVLLQGINSLSGRTIITEDEIVAK